MANPTSIDGKLAVLETDNTDQSISLESDRGYHLSHNGIDTGGSVDSATIFLAVSRAKPDDVTLTAAASSGEDKYQLQDGEHVDLPPGLTYLHFRCINAADNPTFSVAPSERRLGNY